MQGFQVVLLVVHLLFVKDEFRLKVTTSVHAIFEAQYKNFFNSWKSHAPLLRYSIFHIIIIFKSSDARVSTSTQGRKYFWI